MSDDPYRDFLVTFNVRFLDEVWNKWVEKTKVKKFYCDSKKLSEEIQKEREWLEKRLRF